MINLSVKKCQDFKISPVDYEDEENKSRAKNVEMLKDLIKIIKYPRNMVYIMNRHIPFEVRELPTSITDFYKKYFGKVTRRTTAKEIINKIAREYDDLEIKISNLSEKHGLEPRKFWKELETSEIAICLLAKDPSKQTSHQYLAANWLKELPFINSFQEPPAGGKDAIYICNGVPILGKDKGNRKVPKSVDFKMEYHFRDKVFYIYATHKHTKSAGGAQDNQYKDVQEFHMEAKSCKDKNCCLISITDGAYYLTNETLQTKGITKLEYLNSPVFKGSRNFATTCNNFAADIIPYIVEWLEDNFDKKEVTKEIQKLNILKEKCSF